jgi:DNA-binding PadR family transcriptional regulator
MDFSQDLVRGSVVPIVLAMLRDRPMYGYEMVKTVNARTNGLLEWKEGTLYPALHRLEAAGLISGRWEDAGGRAPGAKASVGRDAGAKTVSGKGASGKNAEAEGPGRQRKYYSITRKGRAELARRAQEWRLFSQAVSACVLGGLT